MTTDPTPNHGRGCTLGQPYGECGPECGLQPFQRQLLNNAKIWVDEFGTFYPEPTLREQLERERTWTATHKDVYEWAEKLPWSLKKKKPTEQFIDMLKRLRDEQAEYERLIEEAIG